MYVRSGYIPTTVRRKEREEHTVSSDFIHVRLEAIPPLNVIGVYMETNIKVEDAEKDIKTPAAKKMVNGKHPRRSSF